ncbi:MAG: hypothetical protein F6K30_17130, partial [Cyanothece sp. SIO2G6]|nr:hypothetical protein [Cyanothece sp. SIO2G6]
MNKFQRDRLFPKLSRHGRLGFLVFLGLLLVLAIANQWDIPSTAQLPLPPPRMTGPYCHFVETAVAEKAALRQAAIAGDTTAQ